MNRDSVVASVRTIQAAGKYVHAIPAWGELGSASLPTPMRVAASMMGWGRCHQRHDDRTRSLGTGISLPPHRGGGGIGNNTTKTEPSHRGSVVEVLPDREIVRVGLNGTVAKMLDTMVKMTAGTRESLTQDIVDTYLDDYMLSRMPCVCSGCDTVLAPVFKYCPECGSKIGDVESPKPSVRTRRLARR